MKKIRDLYGHEADYNPREITDEALEGLDQTVREYGDLSGILYNIRTKRLFGGHQRKKVLPAESVIIVEPHQDYTGTVAIGYVDTPSGRFSYREVDWDEDKEKAANLVANAAGGFWDDVKRKDIIEELSYKDYDLGLLGHTSEDLSSILSFSEEDFDGVFGGVEDGDSAGEMDNESDQPEKKGGAEDEKLIRIDANVRTYQLTALDKVADGKNKRSKLLQSILDNWMDENNLDRPH